jgi:hypothetical protein
MRILKYNLIFLKSRLLVSKRMVKQQQMHWTSRGAHMLLQVRAKVLNGELRQTFCRWYPRMKEGSEQPIRLVA